MTTIQLLVYILIFTPLSAGLIGLILRLIPKSIPKKIPYAVSILSTLLSFMISVILLEYVITYQGFVLEDNTVISLIQNIALYFGFYLDNLTSVFIVLTSLMFFLACIFSYKYLIQQGQGFERFYIYMNLLQFFSFCFFISSNLIQSIVFMILGAFAQYLFVNFYFQRPSSQKNSEKVLKINVLADSILFVAAIAFLYFSTLTPDTINVPTLGYNNINSLGLYSFAGLNPLMFLLICLLFISGSIIKSSQFPFISKMHLSSEAPFPIFTLLLSPVILGEGLYLILRIYPLLNLIPSVFEILKIAGIISALIAAIIALKENEIKKILAFAAVSQMGIALCALGFKLAGPAVFHLICAGLSIVLISFCLNALSYSTGSQQNIKFLGGIREKLPYIAYPFLIGAVSFAGFTFSGFSSRAMILNALGAGGNYIYLSLIILTAFLSAFYIFRVYFRVFEGEYKGSYEVQSPSRLMYFTIAALTIMCIFAGFLLNNYINYFISYKASPLVIMQNPFLNVAVFVVCAGGYYLAYKIYFTKELKSLSIRPLRTIAKERFSMDKFVNIIFEDIPNILYKIFSFFEKYVISLIYEASSLCVRLFSFIFNKYKSTKINSSMLAVFITILLLSVIAVIIYFKTGAVK